MELGLSLGERVAGVATTKRLSILDMKLQDDQMAVEKSDSDFDDKIGGASASASGSSSSSSDHHPPAVQLDLLLPMSSSSSPHHHHHHHQQHHLSFSCLTHNYLSGGLGCSKYNIGLGQAKSRQPLGLGILENLHQQQQQQEEGSTTLKMEYFSIFGNKSPPPPSPPPYLEGRNHELIILERGGGGGGGGRASSRANDDDEEEEGGENMNGIRKKLRLTKDQSSFLEDSFKDHTTLNPKQKVALAKQLKLRPRQVEVWFQNRRARTKLKQTEIDCEYLKRCCEKLTEENRKLQKEVHELRALKQSSSQPFYMQLPPTTLTMCPSCERIAAAAATTSNATNTRSPSATTMVFLEAKPIRSIPFSPTLAS